MRRVEEYMGGLILDPARPPGGQPDQTWNIWPGLPFPETTRCSARPTGSWRRLRQHMLDNICAGDWSLFKYLKRYMARLIQHPERRGEVSLVLRSDEEGVGKGRLIWSLARLLPDQHVAYYSTAADLFGQYNKKLATSVLAILDEATFAGDRRQVGHLQTIITEPRIGVNEKYEPRIELANRLHLILSTNQAWAVSASRTARRYAVFKVAPHQLQNRPYFDAIDAELCANDNSGYRRMKHDLLHMNLTGWDHTRTPDSIGLAEQRELSLTVHEQWWADCLTRERIPIPTNVTISQLHLEQPWPQSLSTDELFESYRYFNRLQPRPDQHPLQRNIFGRWLTQDLKLQARRAKHGAPDRRPGYLLGSIEHQRRAFDQRHSTRLFTGEDRANEAAPVVPLRGRALNRARDGQGRGRDA